jgi:FkbM family methyltransferase
VDRLKTLASRNLPSRKPQLWENFPLAVRRRATLELGRRLKSGWLDQPHVVELSEVGLDPALPPLKMEVVPREMMNKALFLYGTFEISETRLVQAFLRPGMTFIDVGANIGYYTLIAARIVGASGSVHAFEPNGEVRARLVHNVHLNNFDQVHVHREAVTGQSGEVRFYVSTWNENSGISSIIPGSALGEPTVVPAVSLDDFVSRLPGQRADLLKMDIEGAELEAIGGGRQLLGSATAPALLFESFEVTRLLPTLEALGYHVRRIHYTLSEGLELRDPRSTQPGLFDAYESPNFFGAKDPAVFDLVLTQVNTRRSSALRLLGRF